MKKIIQVIGTLHIGGAENIALNMYRYINREEYEMHYLVYDNETSIYTTEIEKMGGKIIRVPDIFNNRFRVKDRLYTIFKKYGPYDAVHSHLMFHNGLVLKAAKQAGIPIRISHAHTTNDGRNNSYFRCFYRIIMRHMILKNGTKFIACSEASGNYLYNLKNNFENLIILNNKVDALKFQYNDIRYNKYRSDLFNEGKNIICVGHLIPLKNQSYILDVFKKLLKRDSSFNLTIIGDGELMDELKKLTTMYCINNKVNFVGNVNNVNEYMIGADMLVMPSLYEGLPVTLIEAQAAGLPCLVSENIDHKVNITDLIVFLPINKSDEDKWVEQMIKLSSFDRQDTYDLIKKCHYDISDYKEILNTLYI